jgi:hypothetical protein
MRTLLSAVLLVGLVITGPAGCHRTQITDLPPGVSQKEVQAWYSATGIVKTIAETANGLTDAVISIHQSDPEVIPADDYQNILLALGKTAQAGIHLDAILKQAPENFGKETKEQILAEIQPVIEEIRKADLEGLFSKSQSPRIQAQLGTVKTLTRATTFLLQLAL